MTAAAPKTMNSSRPMNAGEWARLLFLSAIWSASFFLIKIAGHDMPPLMLVLGRVGSAAIALNIFLRCKGLSLPRDPKLWRQFALMGFINNLVPFSLISWAETVIPSGVSGVLNAAAPLWTVVLCALMAGERATPSRLAGTALGFAGVALLIGWQPRVMPGAVLAEIAVVIAALGYAWSGIYGRRFSGLSPYVAACGQLTATTLMMIPLALVVDRPWTLPVPGAESLLAVLALGLMSTMLAYILYFSLLRSAGSLNLVLCTFLMPVGALVLGVAFLDEPAHANVLAGLVLIIGGLACIDGRLLKFRRFSLAPA